MFKNISVEELYNTSMLEHNASFVRSRTHQREVSFQRDGVRKTMGGNGNIRLQDYPDTIYGKIERMNGDETVDIQIDENIFFRVNTRSTFFEDLLVPEIEVLIDVRRNQIKNIEQSIAGYEELLEIAAESPEGKVSRKLLRKQRISNFVALSLNANASTKTIEEGIEQLLSY